MSKVREYGKVYTSIWRDKDWRDLTPDAQWLYMLLLSQPDISTCGVLVLLPNKWVTAAIGMSLERLEAATALLKERRFIVADPDTFEVLVRTYIRHDVGGMGTWTVLMGALRATLRVQSSLLQRVLLDEIRRLDRPMTDAMTAVLDELAAKASRQPTTDNLQPVQPQPTTTTYNHNSTAIESQSRANREPIESRANREPIERLSNQRDSASIQNRLLIDETSTEPPPDDDEPPPESYMPTAAELAAIERNVCDGYDR